MPRAHYIYLVRYNACGTLLGALEDLKRHTSNILKEHGHEPRYRKVNR